MVATTWNDIYVLYSDIAGWLSIRAGETGCNFVGARFIAPPLPQGRDKSGPYEITRKDREPAGFLYRLQECIMTMGCWQVLFFYGSPSVRVKQDAIS